MQHCNMHLHRQLTYLRLGALVAPHDGSVGVLRLHIGMVHLVQHLQAKCRLTTHQLCTGDGGTARLPDACSNALECCPSLSLQHRKLHETRAPNTGSPTRSLSVVNLAQQSDLTLLRRGAGQTSPSLTGLLGSQRAATRGQAQQSYRNTVHMQHQ